MITEISDIKYSVLIAVYDKEKPEYLHASIQSMLSQTVKTDNFVLVADGPLTEELNEVINEFAQKDPSLFCIVRLSENKGVALALREGMTHCRHELIAHIDSDDIALPDRCEKELEYLIKEDIDIVSGTILEFETEINNVLQLRRVPALDAEIRKYARRRSPFNHSAVLYKKSMVLKAGGYIDAFPEDYHLWMRMLESGAKGGNLEEPVLFVRMEREQYARRGTIKHYKKLMNFRFYMYQNNFCTAWDFLVVTLGQAILCLTPLFFRRMLYKLCLREKSKKAF